LKPKSRKTKFPPPAMEVIRIPMLIMAISWTGFFCAGAWYIPEFARVIWANLAAIYSIGFLLFVSARFLARRRIGPWWPAVCFLPVNWFVLHLLALPFVASDISVVAAAFVWSFSISLGLSRTSPPRVSP